jgi:hypothetical protein
VGSIGSWPWHRLSDGPQFGDPIKGDLFPPDSQTLYANEAKGLGQILGGTLYLNTGLAMVWYLSYTVQL